MSEMIHIKCDDRDILTLDGRILEVAGHIDRPEGAEAIDASGCLVTYPFADVHVHLREPGFPEKETIETGSEAALAGGFTSVCAMPNLSPAPDSIETLKLETDIIERSAVIDVHPYCTITKGRKGLELVDFAALKDRCVAFSDDGSGVQDDALMLRAMQAAAREDAIIAAHCEDITKPALSPESEWAQIERDLKLCAKTGCHYHVCHISTARSVALIREAKRAGVNVSCETAPHYLLLCEDDRRDEGRFHMNPPLRTAADRDALLEGLCDGTIDVIATDHAPHTAEQKSHGLKSAMGIVGLETAFPVLYTGLVKKGLISLDRLLELMCTAPRKLFRLGGGRIAPGADADITIIDLKEKYNIDSSTFRTKGRSTPFEGWEVYGRVLRTIHKGK